MDAAAETRREIYVYSEFRSDKRNNQWYNAPSHRNWQTVRASASDDRKIDGQLRAVYEISVHNHPGGIGVAIHYDQNAIPHDSRVLLERAQGAGTVTAHSWISFRIRSVHSRAALRRSFASRRLGTRVRMPSRGRHKERCPQTFDSAQQWSCNTAARRCMT